MPPASCRPAARRRGHCFRAKKPSGGKTLRKTLHLICRLCTAIQAVLMFIMLVVVNFTVVTRYFFSYSPPWKEELTVYSMVWLVMLGAGVLVLFDDHIALYMGAEKLPPRGRHLQRLFSHLVIFACGAVIAWTGFGYSLGMHNVTAEGLQIPMTGPTLAIPVGATLITAFSGLLIVDWVLETLGRGRVSLPDQMAFMDGCFRPADEDCGPKDGPEHLHRGGEGY